MSKPYEIWDNIAPKWDSNITETTNPLLAQYEKAEETKLFEIIKNKLLTGDVSIVEFGCGTGRVLCNIAGAELDKGIGHKIRRFVGVDISKPMIDIAEKNASRWGGLFEFVHADAQETGKISEAIAENTAAIVFIPLNSIGIFLEKDRPGAINSMAKLAGSKGVLFVSVFNAVAFEKNAYEIYAPLTSMVGQFDRKALDGKTNTFRNGEYFSHWFLEDEIKTLVEENLNGTPLEGRKLNVQKVGNVGILIDI